MTCIRGFRASDPTQPPHSPGTALLPRLSPTSQAPRHLRCIRCCAAPGISHRIPKKSVALHRRIRGSDPRSPPQPEAHQPSSQKNQNRVPPLDNPLLQLPLGWLTLSRRLKILAPLDFTPQTRRSPPTGLERQKSAPDQLKFQQIFSPERARLRQTY